MSDMKIPIVYHLEGMPLFLERLWNNRGKVVGEYTSVTV
jgi:hypothetical protein